MTIEFLAVRCPNCHGVLCEVLAGAAYPPFRVRCRKRACGKRGTVTSDGREVRVALLSEAVRQLAS